MATSALSNLSREEGLFLLFLVALAGGATAIFLRNLWHRLRLRRKFRHGLRSEAKAGRILRRYGYTLVTIQEPIRTSLLINGKRRRYEIRPDGFAKKRSRYYAVEVKTGKAATNPLFRETRRQILEYYHAATVDGVLLVNADAETVHHIAFDRAVQTRGWALWWIIGLALVGGVAWYFYV